MKLNAEKSWMSLGCMHFNSRKWQIQGEGEAGAPYSSVIIFGGGDFLYINL